VAFLEKFLKNIAKIKTNSAVLIKLEKISKVNIKKAA